MAYILKITSISPQRNMQALVKFLLRVPGLTPEQVSKGLKVPPFVVLTAEREGQVASIKSVIEKLGAVCAIENTESSGANRLRNTDDMSNTTAHYIKFLSQKREPKPLSWKFWIAASVIVLFLVVLTEILSDNSPQNKQNNQQQSQQMAVAVAGSNNQTNGNAAKGAVSSEKLIDIDLSEDRYAKTSSNELTKLLHQNPYDASAWKALSENLRKNGHTQAAAQAQASYEQAVKVQLILASLARAFGNQPRVEVTENVVYYRTSYDMDDEEFYKEADKLRDSLNTRFPDRDLVIENYTTQNTTQSIRLKAN